MAKIGIAVSTRNRPEMLLTALTHFVKFWPNNHQVKFVVVDDFSDDEHFDKLLDIASECNGKITFVFKPEREGVAKTKNECLRRLMGADYFFLFDDDAFPIQDGWADLYIDASLNTGLQHMLHAQQKGDLRKLVTVKGVSQYNDAPGVMLFMTKKCIAVVGGMNKNFGTWGYEHKEYSDRIYRSGVNCGWGSYVSPENSDDYIYSVDIEMSGYFGENGQGKQPPLGRVPYIRSSTSEEEKMKNMFDYADLFRSKTPIYQEL